MAQPILKIGNHNYTSYVESMEPTKNDLDADGSGRDVQTGKMYRNKITDKITWEVKMLRLPESVAKNLTEDLDVEYYTATTLNPKTGTQVEKSYYTSSIPYGVQRYDKYQNKTFYDGFSFEMIER